MYDNIGDIEPLSCVYVIYAVRSLIRNTLFAYLTNYTWRAVPLCVSMSAQLPRTGLKMRNRILVRLAGGNVVDQKVWTGVGTLWYLPVFPRLRRGGNT